MLPFLRNRWHLWNNILFYMWNMVKNIIKHVHNTFKSPFFTFTLDFRPLIAHDRSHFWHLYVILLLNFVGIQIRTDLSSASLPFDWMNSDPLQPKYLSQQLWSPISAPSSRWITPHSTSTQSIMTEVSNGAANDRFWAVTFVLCPKTLSRSKRSKRETMWLTLLSLPLL